MTIGAQPRARIGVEAQELERAGAARDHVRQGRDLVERGRSDHRAVEREPPQLGELPQRIDLAAAEVRRQERHERVDPVVEVEREVAQLREAGLEVDGVGVDAAVDRDVVVRQLRRVVVRAELPRLQLRDVGRQEVVRGEVERLDVDRELEALQRRHAEPGGVEHADLGEIARQDALRPVDRVRQRQVGALAAARHVHERIAVPGASDREVERLRDCQPELRILDRDERVEERPQRLARQLLLRGRQRDRLAEIEVADLELLADEPVAAALAERGVGAPIAGDQIVAVLAEDAVAVGLRMRVALLRRLDRDRERDVLRRLAGGVVDPQVVPIGLQRPHVDDRPAARHQLTGLRVQVGKQALHYRHDVEPGVARTQSAGKLERERLAGREVLDPDRDPRVAVLEGVAHRLGDVDRGRLAGELRRRREARGCLPVGAGDLVVALALQHRDEHRQRRRDDLIEQARAVFGPVAHPQLGRRSGTGAEEEQVADGAELIGRRRHLLDPLGARRGPVAHPELALRGGEEELLARAAPHRRELARAAGGRPRHHVLDERRAQPARSVELAAGRGADRREVKIVPDDGEVRGEGPGHAAGRGRRDRSEDRDLDGEQAEVDRLVADDADRGLRGRRDVRRADVRDHAGRGRVAGRRLPQLVPDLAELGDGRTLGGILGGEVHDAVEERDPVRLGVRPGHARQLGEGRAVEQEHLPVGAAAARERGEDERVAGRCEPGRRGERRRRKRDR